MVLLTNVFYSKIRAVKRMTSYRAYFVEILFYGSKYQFLDQFANFWNFQKMSKMYQKSIKLSQLWGLRPQS